MGVERELRIIGDRVGDVPDLRGAIDGLRYAHTQTSELSAIY